MISEQFVLALHCETVTRYNILKILSLTFCLCLLPRSGSTGQEPADNKTNILELPTFSILQKTESFELKTGSLEFTVKYPPILPNSERVTEAGGKVLVRGIDYRIDPYLGKITLTEPDATVESSLSYRLTITYRTLPFAIKRVYKRDLYGVENPQTDTTGFREESSVASENFLDRREGLTDGRQPTTDNQYLNA